jgi:hypothetical protein
MAPWDAKTSLVMAAFQAVRKLGRQVFAPWLFVILGVLRDKALLAGFGANAGVPNRPHERAAVSKKDFTTENTKSHGEAAGFDLAEPRTLPSPSR